MENVIVFYQPERVVQAIEKQFALRPAYKRLIVLIVRENETNIVAIAEQIATILQSDYFTVRKTLFNC